MPVVACYAPEPLPDRVTRVIFLAGPTPRSPAVPSWRPAALAALEAAGFDGHVLVPEPRDGTFRTEYDDQVAWEHAGLGRADCVLFWIPRQLDTMPAFTTNIELGMLASSGRVVLGAPPDAPKLRYPRSLAAVHDIPCADRLDDAVALAVARVGAGAQRRGAECQVPADVFASDAFQRWYRAQQAAGNRLRGARVLWTARVGPRRDLLFYWAVHVQVWVRGEDRVKQNEIVLARPDVAAVVLYRRHGDHPGDAEIALVREFRSAVRNRDAMVREPPSGSSDGEEMTGAAAREVREEAGLALDPARLRPLGSRQLAATMSSHHARVFACELTADEMAALAALGDTVHGDGRGERTYVEVWRARDLFAGELTDWSTLGMVAAALSE